MRNVWLVLLLTGCTGLGTGSGTDVSAGTDADSGADPGDGPGGGGTVPGSDSGTTPTDGERFHPSGYAAAAAHGTPSKLQQDDCLTCHGADLTGGTSGVSCDSCHQPDWRTNCTYCHGGVEDATGAPPENIDDSTGPLAQFPTHSAHVQQTNHPAFGCAECHAQPTDPLTPGHVFVGDSTPGVSEVAVAGGTWSAGSCTTACHGDGQGGNGAADASFVSTCDACHADWTSGDAEIDGMSGEHSRHVSGEGYDCSECHSRTVDAGHAIVDPTVHVDGTPTVAMVDLSWDPVDETCNGSCHGRDHNDWGW